MKSKKSCREKLADDKGLPKVGEVTGKLTKRWGTGRFIIPAPREVDALMKQVPKGRVATINELRAALVHRHKTDFWRTLKTGGEINPKYPGGSEGVAKRLRAEGHRIVSKGKRTFVAGHEKKLFTKLR